MRDDCGTVIGIFREGFDVTEPHLAREALRRHAERQDFRLALEERLRDQRAPGAIMAAAAEVLGRHLDAGQIAYAEIDLPGAHAIIERDWNDGTTRSNVGVHHLDSFGPAFIADLKRWRGPCRFPSGRHGVPVERQPAPSRRGAAMIALTGQHILIVDDEFLVAAMAEDLLSQLGAVVVGPAYTLAEGLRLASEEIISSSILDIDLNGLRSDPIADVLRARGIPYVITTGYGETGAMDGVHVLDKPYTQADLAAALLACASA